MPPTLKRTIEKMDLMGKKSSKAQDKETYTPLLCRLALILVIGYAAAVILFYFLAGEQLHLRQSRDNTELPVADSGTVELTVGRVVEQRFTTEIQRLERINIQWGTYYQPNAGITGEKGNPKSLRKLYLPTRANMESNISLRYWCRSNLPSAGRNNEHRHQCSAV